MKYFTDNGNENILPIVHDDILNMWGEDFIEKNPHKVKTFLSHVMIEIENEKRKGLTNGNKYGITKE